MHNLVWPTACSSCPWNWNKNRSSSDHQLKCSLMFLRVLCQCSVIIIFAFYDFLYHVYRYRVYEGVWTQLNLRFKVSYYPTVSSSFTGFIERAVVGEGGWEVSWLRRREVGIRTWIGRRGWWCSHGSVTRSTGGQVCWGFLFYVSFLLFFIVSETVQG